MVDEQHRQRFDVEGEIIGFTNDWTRVRDSAGVSMSELSTVKQAVREALENGEAQKCQRRSPRRDPLLPEPTPVNERPEEYWHNVPAEQWELIASRWERYPEDQKAAIPDAYIRLVESLRRWEPWEDEKGNRTR